MVLQRSSDRIGGEVSEIRVDASMTYTEPGNYDFVTAELLVRGEPRCEDRFDLRESVVRALLLPKREPVGGHVISDKDCKICLSGKKEKVYSTERCCSFGLFIDLLVSRNVFMRGNPEVGDGV